MRSVVKLPCMRRDRKAGDGPDGGIFFNPPVDPADLHIDGVTCSYTVLPETRELQV